MNRARIMILPAIGAAILLGGAVGSVVPTSMKMVEDPQWQQLKDRLIPTASAATYQYTNAMPNDLSPDMPLATQGAQFAPSQMPASYGTDAQTAAVVPADYSPPEPAPLDADTSVASADQADAAPAASAAHDGPFQPEQQENALHTQLVASIY